MFPTFLTKFTPYIQPSNIDLFGPFHGDSSESMDLGNMTLRLSLDSILVGNGALEHSYPVDMSEMPHDKYIKVIG